MHSFYPSRGRILFEVLCAFAMVTFCVGAWVQTHASALLGAAAVAALYGLVHLFDVRRPQQVEATEPQRIDFEPEASEIVVPMVLASEAQVLEATFEEAEVVELPAPKAERSPRTKSPRKGAARRTKPSKEAKVSELALPGEAETTVHDEATVVELVPTADENLAFLPEAAAHPHIEPLFEPEPFARMPRRAFGRRGRI